jgi:hypothetical protein
MAPSRSSERFYPHRDVGQAEGCGDCKASKMNDRSPRHVSRAISSMLQDKDPSIQEESRIRRALTRDTIT